MKWLGVREYRFCSCFYGKHTCSYGNNASLGRESVRVGGVTVHVYDKSASCCGGCAC